MIPTELYESYAAAIEENDRQAIAALDAIMQQLDPNDVGSIRNVLLMAYPELVRLYGERAAKVAYEFYMELRETQDVEAWLLPQMPADDEYEADAIADVRREIGGLYSGTSSMKSFTSRMRGLTTKRTMEMSDRVLNALANADPAHPKVALVPHAGACGWCVLIGSRGFTNTKSAMDHMRHDGCKCTRVVDFDRRNPALQGYHPEELYDYYDAATRNKKFGVEWNAMSDEEKSKYVAKKRDRTGAVSERPGDFSTYVRNRTVQEMNVLLGNTKRSLKGADINGVVYKVDNSVLSPYGVPRKTKPKAAQPQKGTDAAMSAKADEILKKYGIRK